MLEVRLFSPTLCRIVDTVNCTASEWLTRLPSKPLSIHPLTSKLDGYSDDATKYTVVDESCLIEHKPRMRENGSLRSSAVLSRWINGSWKDIASVEDVSVKTESLCGICGNPGRYHSRNWARSPKLVCPGNVGYYSPVDDVKLAATASAKASDTVVREVDYTSHSGFTPTLLGPRFREGRFMDVYLDSVGSEWTSVSNAPGSFRSVLDRPNYVIRNPRGIGGSIWARSWSKTANDRRYVQARHTWHRTLLRMANGPLMPPLAHESVIHPINGFEFRTVASVSRSAGTEIRGAWRMDYPVTCDVTYGGSRARNMRIAREGAD